jgi:hypothetical protein
VTWNEQKIECGVLKDIGEIVEDSSGNDTEPTEDTVWVTDREWTDSRREQ